MIHHHIARQSRARQSRFVRQPQSGQYALVQVVNARRAAVITELRELVAQYGTGCTRISVPTVTAGIAATSYSVEEYAVLVAAARSDRLQHGSDLHRLRWWVLSLAADIRFGVSDLLPLTWADLNSLGLSSAVWDEVLTPEHLTLLRTSTWLEATTLIVSRGVV